MNFYLSMSLTMSFVSMIALILVLCVRRRLLGHVEQLCRDVILHEDITLTEEEISKLLEEERLYDDARA